MALAPQLGPPNMAMGTLLSLKTWLVDTQSLSTLSLDGFYHLDIETTSLGPMSLRWAHTLEEVRPTWI